MTTPIPPMCVVCVHARQGLVCTAFPDGIPDSILFGGVDHRQPVEGDQGVQFEADPQASPEEIEVHLAQYDDPSTLSSLMA